MINKILITGGAGFIGANLANHYLSLGRRVTVFDNFSSRGSGPNAEWLERNHADGLRIIHGDIRQPSAELKSAVEDCDVVFHLAAQVAVSLSVTDPKLDFEVNAAGTFQILECVRTSAKQPVLIYSSTNKVYGRLDSIPVEERASRYEFGGVAGISEQQPVEFHSPYGCSKGSADSYVIDYARLYGLRTVTFRQSCIYGPRQFGTEDQGWLAWFTLRALGNEPVTLFGNGKQMRDILFVDDLIEAYELAINNIERTSGQAYNIGGGPENTLSLLELIALLEKRTGRPMQYSCADWRPGDQLVFVSDINKAKHDFGWMPRTNPAAGVNLLYDWMAEHLG